MQQLETSRQISHVNENTTRLSWRNCRVLHSWPWLQIKHSEYGRAFCGFDVETFSHAPDCSHKQNHPCTPVFFNGCCETLSRRDRSPCRRRTPPSPRPSPRRGQPRRRHQQREQSQRRHQHHRKERRRAWRNPRRSAVDGVSNAFAMESLRFGGFIRTSWMFLPSSSEMSLSRRSPSASTPTEERTDLMSSAEGCSLPARLRRR